MLMKQCPLYVWEDRLDTARLICRSLKRRCSSRGGLIFYAEQGSSSAHNVCWFDGCVLDAAWFDYSFHGGPCLPSLLNIRRARCWLRAWPYLKSYELSDSHKVPLEHWWPALNGAWPSFWLLLSPEVILSCRCLSLLSSGVWASWSGFDLHTHSGSVPAFVRPLKDDKIQCWMGAGSPQAVH